MAAASIAGLGISRSLLTPAEPPASLTSLRCESIKVATCDRVRICSSESASTSLSLGSSTFLSRTCLYRRTAVQARADRVLKKVNCVLGWAKENQAEAGNDTSAEVLGALESSLPVDGGSRIWLSDVVGRKQRPYFLNREWTSKDLSYAIYMIGVHGLCLAAPFTFSWDALAVFGIMYVITGMFGITLSYHRQLSHKSFKTPKWLEYLFAYCGVLAVQGDPIEWVSAHRYHHQHCDTPQDPHTPYEGFWYSHMGWLLDDKATQERVGKRGNIADMQNDPFYMFIEKTYPLHIAGMAAVLFALGGFPYLVWGLAVRAVWVYHITWAVNSAAHVWGSQSWNTGDLSRNNWWVALLAFGEGWHNNHHAFEYSARHGLDWWQFDPTWYTVKALEVLGLATKVRYPTKEHMNRLRKA